MIKEKKISTLEELYFTTQRVGHHLLPCLSSLGTPLEQLEQPPLLPSHEEKKMERVLFSLPRIQSEELTKDTRRGLEK
jgi:hypothetical protein